MSLDVHLEKEVTEVKELYWRNITHNLNKMAALAGLYKPLWQPNENGYEKASQLIKPLTDGLKELEDNPEPYRALNPENGWGSYDGLVSFVREYLQACKDNPDADINVSK